MANSHLQFEASIDLDRDRNQWYSISCYNLRLAFTPNPRNIGPIDDMQQDLRDTPSVDPQPIMIATAPYTHSFTNSIILTLFYGSPLGLGSLCKLLWCKRTTS